MNIDIDKLERLASAVSGWSNCSQAWLDTSEDDTAAVVGHINEDGATYPVATIDCDQYYHGGDSLPLAKFYAAANPAAVLELVGEVRRLRAELAAAQAREKSLRTGLRSAFDHIEMASLEASHCNDAARISDALAYRSDDTDLRQAIKVAKEEMRERAARHFDGMPGYEAFGMTIANDIRALEVE